MEIAFSRLRGIHGTAAVANGQVFAGAGEAAAEERLGSSLVACPGRLDLGVYSVIDIHSGSVEVGELPGVTAGRTP